jgi:hypothetical protein
MQIAQPLDLEFGPVGHLQLHRDISFHPQHVDRAHGALQLDAVLGPGFVHVVDNARGQPEAAQTFGDGETDRAVGLALRHRGHPPHVRDRAFDIACRKHHPAAFVGQPHAFGFPEQQQIAELVFKPRDRAPCGVDRHAKLFGSLAEAVEPRDSQKDPDTVPIGIAPLVFHGWNSLLHSLPKSTRFWARVLYPNWKGYQAMSATPQNSFSSCKSKCIGSGGGVGSPTHAARCGDGERDQPAGPGRCAASA